MYRKNDKVLYIFLAAFFVSLFAACERDLDVPPLNSLDPNLVPNTTIAELKQLYDGSEDFVTIEEDIILGAVVAANDQSGNFYRQIIISDESGGIELKINDNDLYNQYPLGQLLYIKVQNLILGSYGGIVQLGGTVYDSGGLRLGGIETNKLPEHVFRISGGEIPEPTILSLGGNLDDHIYTMVQLENVQFTEANLGMPFANPSQTTNRTITDCDGNTIIVRTSSFANFASYDVPEGNGTIKAVLTKFVNDYQLVINEYEDLDMNGTRCEIEGGPEGDGSFESPFNVAAAVGNNTGSGMWVQGYIVGVRETDVDPFEDNFNAPFRTNSNIMLADSPDETNTSVLLMVQLPIGDVRDAINLVDNPENLGELVKLRGNLTAYFGAPGLRDTYQFWMEGMPDPDPDPDPVQTVFEENFDSDLGTFTAFNITGPQEWNHVTFDGGSAYMNGFAGGAIANEDWLVSPAIDLSGETNVSLNIREAINYLSSYDDLKVLVANDYDESGPTASGTWVELTGYNRPPGNNWTYVESGNIDISQFDGQTIHVALKYISTSSQASGWQVSRISVVADE